MQATERRHRFRELLASSRCFCPASVFDPISARIAEDLGFEMMMMAGSTISALLLGAPDLALLTPLELADQAYRVCHAGTLPLLVDADHGYGNALNVMRAVEELERAGVAALTIADRILPAPFAAFDRVELISTDEAVGKIAAALRARSDPSLVIAGRTVALSNADLPEAIARCKAYEAAGAEALFMVGLNSREQLDAVAAAHHLPILLGVVPAAMRDREYLASRRVRVCLHGQQPFGAAVQAVYDTLKALRDGTSPDALERVASPDMRKRVVRDATYVGWLNEFLAGP